MQPDIHAGGIVGVAGVAELLGELLARRDAGIDVERLHQVDDRGAPCQLFFLAGNRLVEDGRDIDGLRRRSRCCRGRSRAAGWGSRTACGRRTACRRCRGRGAEDRAHNFAENTHRFLPVNQKKCERFERHFIYRRARTGSFESPPNSLSNAGGAARLPWLDEMTRE
jgi:hypothetical protein